ncbi:MAG: Sec-independent protein translocase protein TatB [bacterium]|nr:Sec-independent protein translocase protein TatB [bacterium]MDI1227782.1 Sec-independent protein translocase protein TatB [bacterium]
MFDVAWSEMLVIIAVAVVVIGPKDLPKLLYAAGKFTRKVKIFTHDIQTSLDRIIHDEELNEITREANKPGGENLQFEIERQLAEEERRKIAMLPKEQDDRDG